MWLLNAKTLQLEFAVNENQEPYAILSHRWEDEEVLFEDLVPRKDAQYKSSRKAGWQKIEFCCQQALRDGLRFVWVDTCCINKDSSAELQEAINSMYRWYESARICYAYLSDVAPCPNEDVEDGLMQSQWFHRGWTLQELVAPSLVVFYNADWNKLGTRTSLMSIVYEITGIPQYVLRQGFGKVASSQKPCVAEIMTWAKNRQTTRVEDRAYSLLGLFDVNMPMLYGEGEKAFARLQEAILSTSEDQTIFAWDGVSLERPSLLAQSPDQYPSSVKQFVSADLLKRRSPLVVNNVGIEVEFDLVSMFPNVYCALINLDTSIETEDSLGMRHANRFGIYVKRLDSKSELFARIPYPFITRVLSDLTLYDPTQKFRTTTHTRRITVVRQLRGSDRENLVHEMYPAIRICVADDVWDTWSEGPDWPSYKMQRHIKTIEAENGTTTKIVMAEYGTGCCGWFGLSSIGARQDEVPVALMIGFDFDYEPICILDSLEPRSHPHSICDFLRSRKVTAKTVPDPLAIVESKYNARVTTISWGVLAIGADVDGSKHGFSARITHRHGTVFVQVQGKSLLGGWDFDFKHSPKVVHTSVLSKSSIGSTKSKFRHSLLKVSESPNN